MTRVRTFLLYSAFGSIILLAGVSARLYTREPMIVPTIIGFILILPLIWNRPSLGVYILVGGAVVFETFPLHFPDSITDGTRFFQTFSARFGPSFLLVNAAEMVMVATLATVALRRMAVGDRPLSFGPMISAIGVYAAMVAFGLVYGLGRGGNLESALWEVRGQAYLGLTYLMVVNTINEKRQVNRLLWIFLIGIALKGVIGSWRFLVTMGADLGRMEEVSRNADSILSHEESYFFALLFAFALILFLFRSHRAQLWFISLAASPVLVAMIVNQRRAGFLVLILAVTVVVCLAYRFLEFRRRAILGLCLILALFLLIYIGANWNSTGLLAEPIRAVRSLVQPNERDSRSNSYREIEALNLKYNIQENPLLGSGYGHSITFYIPLPWIGGRFADWDIIPHNTILWVWMRLGVVGFSAFWFLVGRSILGSMMITKHLSDPYLKSIGVFTVAVLVTWVFVGMIEMGLTGFRELILIGFLIGLVSQTPQMAHDQLGESTSGELTNDRGPENDLGTTNGVLATANGGKRAAQIP